MTRTDVHAPASVDFDPEAYDCVGVFDMQPEFPSPEEARYRFETINALLAKGYRFGAGHSTQCGHCGASIRYAALMVRDDVKQFIYVGETCLDNRFELTKGEFQTLRKNAALNRERESVRVQREAFLAEHPVLVWGTYAHNIGQAGGTEVIEGASDDETRTEGHFAQRTKSGQTLYILGDVCEKALRYLNVSEKQEALVHRLLDQLDQAEGRIAVREAEIAALTAAGVRVPTGRIVVEGTVLSTKWVDNQFGGSLKMLVESAEGWKVWGTVASSIDVEKGTKVRFTAKITKSNDDQTFGFYSRPTKAEVV